MTSSLNRYRIIRRSSAYGSLPYVKPLYIAYNVFPFALGLPHSISNTSQENLTQYTEQPTIHANEKLVGQSGRIYQIERILQSKEVPPSHVYLTT